MGLDLTLLPFDADYDELCFSHTVLSCDRNGQLFCEIMALPSEPVLEGFSSYMSNEVVGDFDGIHYGPTKTTPYGEQVTFVKARQLCKLQEIAGLVAYKNVAVWAYLQALDPETKVALFWH